MVRHLLNESQSQGLRKGAWTQEEDELLRKCIEKYGAGKWRHVPKMAGLNRCRKSCRLRWVNYLSPGIKRGHFDADEEELVIRLHKLLGNRWSLIAGRLPGRTANDVKNYWNSHLRKKINTNHEIEDTIGVEVTGEIEDIIGVEVTGSDQQINFSKWTSSNDQMSSDSKHQEVKSNIPNPTSTLSNPVALTDNIIIPEESQHAILPAGFMAMEVDTSIRIEDIEGFDDEDLVFGTVGGWEYPLLGFDGWCDLGIL